MLQRAFSVMLAVLAIQASPCLAALRAGAARVDITDRDAGPVNDPSYVKALALDDGVTKAVIITVDAVALGEIGRIDNGYLSRVRARLQAEIGVDPKNVIVNASHCHSVVRRDVDALTVQAVREAWRNLTPVRAGAARGREDRIMENRRMRMKDGSEVDVRRAYSMPRDEDVASVGPVDPEIGLLRLDRLDGRPLAVIYNFAAHPIQGVPGGGNTADYPGFAAKVIEETLGEGVLAFFVQGCAGDINPIRYKDVHQPHDAEPLGNMLGLSVLRAWRSAKTVENPVLRAINERLTLPRGADLEHRMSEMRTKRERLMKSLQGTSLNFKTFISLYVQYKLAGDFPSYYSQGYLHERAAGREDLRKLDAENWANLEQYARNIQTMEEITRLQTNLALLEKHHAAAVASGSKTLEVEVAGLRVGDFRLVTFPGELTVEIGLNIKKRSAAPFTFVAGYTNGYIYYTPTAEQRGNSGYAQEDCDSLVAPEWQQLFEAKAAVVIDALSAR